MPPTQHDTPTHKHFLRSLILRCVRKYFHVARVLAPFFLAPTYFNATLALINLHLKSDEVFPLFLEEYKPNQDLEFSSNSFKLTFQHMPNLSSSGFSRMVFEPL